MLEATITEEFIIIWLEILPIVSTAFKIFDRKIIVYSRICKFKQLNNCFLHT